MTAIAQTTKKAKTAAAKEVAAPATKKAAKKKAGRQSFEETAKTSAYLNLLSIFFRWA